MAARQEPARRRLGRRDRLRGAAAFARVFRSGRRLGAGRIQLLFAPAAASTGRVGYVIGRKELPRAVDRNRLRRLLREVLRLRRGVTREFDIVLRLCARCASVELPGVAAEASFLLDDLARGTRR